jgi:Domain of unknown function (DUF222)/HNH endonuclease
MMGVGGTSPTSQVDVASLTDRFRETLFADLALDDYAGRLVRTRQAIDHLDLGFSRDAAAFAAGDQFRDDDSASPIDWMRYECKMQFGTAADRLNVGEQLSRLVKSAEALVTGEIGFAHLTVMARTLSIVAKDTPDAHVDETELLEQAKTCTPGRLWHFCIRLRHALNAAAVAAEQRFAAEERWLRLAPFEDGSVSISGRLDSIGGAALRTALEPLARPTGQADDRCLERRYGDGVVELAMLVLDSGRLPHVASQRPHLQVTTTLETLRGLTGSPAADMEFAQPIATATVQRLACDSSISRVIFGPDSTVIDAGRARRVVSGSARRALNARDQFCRWPGCERTASRSSAHHLVHWIEGGTTDLSNLILLCHRHHWMVHEGGWKLVQAKDDRLLAVPPTYRYSPPVRAPDETAAA